MLSKKKKTSLMKKYATHKGDTGSPEVQIAILSAEIEELAEHLKTHRKDNSSRRGLLGKVHQRRKLMTYLSKENEEAYASIVKKLKLKKIKKETEVEKKRAEGIRKIGQDPEQEETEEGME